MLKTNRLSNREAYPRFIKSYICCMHNELHGVTNYWALFVTDILRVLHSSFWVNLSFWISYKEKLVVKSMYIPNLCVRSYLSAGNSFWCSDIGWVYMRTVCFQKRKFRTKFYKHIFILFIIQVIWQIFISFDSLEPGVLC